MSTLTPLRKPSAAGVTRPAPTRSPVPFEEARVLEHLSTVAQLMNTYHVRHILRVYAAFDGDLLEAVVLGEVAHHNLSAFRSAAANARELSALLKRRDEPGAPPLLPTNAFSLATATGIPRETIRRKIDSLVGKRFLRRERSGALFVTPVARDHFAMFNVESVAALLETCRQIESLLHGDDEPAEARRTDPRTDPRR